MVCPKNKVINTKTKRCVTIGGRAYRTAVENGHIKNVRRPERVPNQLYYAHEKKCPAGKALNTRSNRCVTIGGSSYKFALKNGYIKGKAAEIPKVKRSRKKKLYKLTKEDINLLLNEIATNYARNSKYNLEKAQEIKKYVTNFTTTDRKLYGYYNVYDAKMDGYQGLYGYLKDQIEGGFQGLGNESDDSDDE